MEPTSNVKDNADIIVEFRNMFLEKYLENNKIGRKSKCHLKNKSKSNNNINCLNSYMHKKMINKSCNIPDSARFQIQDALFCEKVDESDFDERCYIKDNNQYSISFDSTFLSNKKNCDSSRWNRQKEIENEDESSIFTRQNSSFNNNTAIDNFHDKIQINNKDYYFPDSPFISTSSSYSDLDETISTTPFNICLNDFIPTLKSKPPNGLFEIQCSSERLSKDSNNQNDLILNNENLFVSDNEWLSVELNFD